MRETNLTEALDILKANNAEVLTETTAFSAPTYCLGMLVSYAIDKYLKDLKAQLEALKKAPKGISNIYKFICPKPIILHPHLFGIFIKIYIR